VDTKNRLKRPDDLLGSIAGNKPDANPHRRIPEIQER
jgi:hypothetical protein